MSLARNRSHYLNEHSNSGSNNNINSTTVIVPSNSHGNHSQNHSSNPIGINNEDSSNSINQQIS